LPNSQNYREKWSLWTNRNCCSRGGSSRPEEKRYTVLLNLVIMSLLRLLFISFCSDCRCSYCQHSSIRIIIIIHMPFSCSTYYGCVMHSWLLADVSSVSGVFADAFSSAGGDSYAAASCGNPSLAAAVFADLRYKLFSRWIKLCYCYISFHLSFSWRYCWIITRRLHYQYCCYFICVLLSPYCSSTN
jgi:hypothetical protein